MNHLQNFNFKGNEVRTVTKNGQVWFVLKDVCDVLGLRAPDVRQRLSGDVVSNHTVLDSLGRNNMASVINEDGLYDVIFESRKPEARAFRKWVTSDVLPTIRKHGAYMTPETIERTLTDPDFIIGLATQLKHANEEKERLAKQIDQDKPYTAFGKVVASSDASVNIGTFAKMLYEKHGINIGRNKLFEWLREKGYLIKGGREKNNPKQLYLEQELFEVRPTIISRAEGDVEKLTTLITGKGQVKLAQILINEFKPVEGVS